MDKSKAIIEDSSEASLRPVVVPTSIDEPVSVHPPSTLYLTATTEAQSPILPVSTTGVPESKWKPLIGTPSKPPVPDDILVPDPSPARTFSDTDSPTLLAPSTPGSFIHQRRQGEYVPRPPVWTTYRMDGSSFTSRDPPIELDLTPNGKNLLLPFRMKQENRKPSSQSLFGEKIPGSSFDNNIPKMAESFRESPLVVNMMQNLTPELHPNPDAPRLPSIDEPSFAKDTAFANLTGSMEQNNSVQGSPTNAMTTTGLQANAVNNCTRLQAGSGTDLECAIRPATAVTENSRNRFPEESNSIQCNSMVGGTSTQQAMNYGSDDLITPAPVRDVSGEPSFDMMEGPCRSLDRILSYRDIRIKPAPNSSIDSNSMVVGSLVTFVGRTLVSDDNDSGSHEVNLPRGDRYIVIEMYGDYWALFLKLERGLQLGEIEQSSFFGWKPKPKPPRRTEAGTDYIGVLNHPTIFVYAPLCAFSLAITPGVLEPQRGRLHSQSSATSHGGLAQASIRSYSLLPEREDVKRRFIWIPKSIYQQYMNIVNPPTPTVDAAAIEPHGQITPMTTNNSSRRSSRPLNIIRASTEPVNYSPAQNIKNLFNRRKNVQVVATPAARLDEAIYPTDVQYGDGAGSPHDQPTVTADSPPRLVPVLSLQSLSEHPDLPTYVVATQARDPDAPRVRDTTLTTRPVSADDLAVHSSDAGQLAPSELVIRPVTMAMRKSSDPTPRPKHKSPLTNAPSAVAEDDIPEASGNKENRVLMRVKSFKFGTATKSAGQTIKRLMPALLEGHWRPTAKAPALEGTEGYQSSSTRRHLIEPCKNAARSWRDFKAKRHPRKSILPQNFHQPDAPLEALAGSNGDLADEMPVLNDQHSSIAGDLMGRTRPLTMEEALAAPAIEGFTGDNLLIQDRQLSIAGDSTSSNRRMTMQEILASPDAEAAHENEQLRHELDAQEPLPTNQTSNLDANANAHTEHREEILAELSGEAADQDSSPLLPTPGLLSSHLSKIAPDKRVKGLLDVSAEDLVRNSRG